MLIRLLCMLSFLCFHLSAYAQDKKYYDLTDDPIDVVIVTHPKDKLTLDDCIEGIKKNSNKVRRVIVVSSEPLTEKAEFY